jgi:hypothetical protein
MNFAVLDANNLVVNIIVAPNLEIATMVTGLKCIECTQPAFIGDTWDGTNFVRPEVSQPE